MPLIHFNAACLIHCKYMLRPLCGVLKKVANLSFQKLTKIVLLAATSMSTVTYMLAQGELSLY